MEKPPKMVFSDQSYAISKRKEHACELQEKE
jgi:hypothetical protein